MGVSFKSSQPEIPPALLRRPQFFACVHGQAETSSGVAAGLYWGLAVLKLGADLPFHVNDADFCGF